MCCAENPSINPPKALAVTVAPRTAQPDLTLRLVDAARRAVRPKARLLVVTANRNDKPRRVRGEVDHMVIDPQRPWSTEIEKRYDAVVGIGLFHDNSAPYAILAYLSSLAPFMVLDCPCQPDETSTPGLHATQDATAGAMERWLVMAAEELDLDIEMHDGSIAMLSRRRDRLSPLIVHFHIPKTAGQSFNEYLSNNVDGNMMHFYPSFPSKARWDLIKKSANEPIEEATPPERGLRARIRAATLPDAPGVLAAHACRIMLPGMLGGRLPLYVGFVREPYKQVLSYIKYIKHRYADLTPYHQQKLPEQTPEMEIEELVRWHVKNVSWNLFGGLVTPVFFLTDRPDLDRAKHLAERFLMLGVVEQMSRSIALLKHKLRPYGFSFEGEMPHLNTTSDVDLGGYDIRKDPVFNQYAGRLMEVEMEFYQWAVGQFECEAVRQGV